jgi:Threonine dehydrogenase and related Zn-dependent dehydrogenases
LNQKTMKALIYTAPNQIELQDIPVPTLKHPTDAIVKVTVSTICGSDLHVIGGHLGIPTPVVMGHEFCGEVIEVGSAVGEFAVGDRVAVSCVASCGVCENCRNGQPVHCLKEDSGCFGVSPLLDGAQAEYCRIPYADNTMYHIPEDMSYEQALFVGDILSTGYFGAEKADIHPGDSVLVMGAGPVGMCAANTARLFGPGQIIMVDTVQERLDACLENGIADVVINAKQVNVLERVKELTNGRGVDRSIEAVGTESTMISCMEAVRVGGNVSLLGVFSAPVTIPMHQFWIRNLTLNSGFVPVDHIPEMLRLLQHGKLKTDFLITHRAPLNDVVKGYDYFKNKKDGCIKWLITPYEHK